MSTLRTLLAAPFVVLVYLAWATLIVAGWLAMQVEGEQ